jgi:hypothetical protein
LIGANGDIGVIQSPILVRGVVTMVGAAFMNMSNTPAARRPARRVSPQEVLRAHEAMCDEPCATDLMVYRQPLSDVPVPAVWRVSSPLPLDSMDGAHEAPESMRYDEETLGWESAGVMLARSHHPQGQTAPCRIAERQRAARWRVSVVVALAVVTCSVIGWVAMR